MVKIDHNATSNRLITNSSLGMFEFESFILVLQVTNKIFLMIFLTRVYFISNKSSC